MLERFKDNLRFVCQPKRKPMLMPRVASSMARHRLVRDVRRRPLRNVDVALSYACNMRCEHCSCELMKQKGGTPMTSDDHARLADEAVALGAIYFAFTGGEPLLNKDLEDTIQLFHPRECLIGLQTNAVLLDDARIDSLYRAGLDSIQVSLDSGDPERHDHFRRMPGAYETTIHNVDRALAKGLRVIFCTTLTHSTIRTRETTDLLEFCKGKHVPVVISVPCPVGMWQGNFDESLDDEDRAYFLELQMRYPQLRRDFHSNYSKLGCSAGTEKLYITPYGDVIPCPFIHISFGNVKEESLGAIRSRMLRLDRFTQYNQVCLAGEDKQFIEQYIKPTYEARQLPQRWERHPNLAETLV
ncbi:MAG: radical SAM protein [Phycisphaerae bacterium]|nr:radical SAM protein [Phycisphaerae bacterium]